MLPRLAWAAAFAFALAAPLFMSGYHLYQFAQVLIYAIALLGLNLLTGYNGQLSLGHGAFFALGGYGSAILIVKFGLPYWAAIPVAGAACFVAGFLFGFPALRLGGLYLALATFALAVATPQLLAYKGLDFLTGGSQGLQTPKPGPLFGLPMTTDQSVFWLCLARRRRAVRGRLQSRPRPRRPRARRHSRPSRRRRDHGRRRRVLQDRHLRDQRALRGDRRRP